MQSKYNQHKEYVNLDAKTVDEYFSNKLPYLVKISNPSWPEWMFQVEELEKWCSENSEGCWSSAYLRFNDSDMILNMMSKKEYIVFAFEKESDATMFTLNVH